jgi:2-polyprenyl-3-methyl-5-hydroxy-6-metoxy-1,4-benzoquinol methylase
MITLRFDRFKLQSACPLCSADTFRKLGRPRYQRVYEVPRDLVVLDKQAIEQRMLVRCGNCGLVYNRFIPRGETLDFLYDVPTDGSTWKFVTKGRPIEDKLAFLNLLPQDKKVRVLDVGCYTGGFLSLLPDHWLKHGLDPCPQALDLARQLLPTAHFTQGRLEDFQATDGPYDLIALWDVAEHLEDVDGALVKVSSMLADGGLLVIETGDVDSLVARVMQHGWYYVNMLEHFCFFSEVIFRRTLPKYGLGIVSCTRTVHHFDRTQAIRTQPAFWAYFALTLGGRVSVLWRAISKVFDRKGYSQVPAARDHIHLIARKSKLPYTIATRPLDAYHNL